MVIKNGKIVTPEKILSGVDVRICDGVILELGEGLVDKTCIDARGGYVTPGFVDIHTHGGVGYDFMDSSHEAYDTLRAYYLNVGTTTVVPTSCTAPVENIIAFLEFARNYVNGRDIFVGVHLEGPYLSVKNKGAQKEDYLKIPELDDYSYMLRYKDIIKTVTISAELPGAPKMTADLTRAGIVVSGGHDDGIYPEFMPAIEAGLSHLTHLYCAMSELRFKDGVRNVGLREYGLIDDRLTAEIIADNRHIPPELARLIIRSKGADRVALVSDSLRCAGCPKDDRVYKLGSDENAQLVKIGDGVAITSDGERFAGSITSVREMVKNLVDAGIPVVDAVKMGTLTPARIIGEAQSVGSIEVGKRANICILDSDFNLVSLILNGECIK